MPPKQTSKKSEQKKKEKKIEDKTFGLKNKGKSKAVQKYVNTVAANINQHANRRAQEKRSDKEAKRREEEEMKALFRTMVSKKDLEKEEEEKKKAAEAEAKAKEVDNRCLEEIIDDERAKIDRSLGTPVTEENFMRWKEERRQRRDAEALRLHGKKAQKAISGRLLFATNRGIFNDDESAVGNDLSEFVEPPQEETKEDSVAVEDAAKAVDSSLYLEDVGADDLDDLDDD